MTLAYDGHVLFTSVKSFIVHTVALTTKIFTRGLCHKNFTEVITTVCGKIGYLPNKHAHVRARVSDANLCADINCWRNLFLTQTCFEGWQKELLLRCVIWRFHDILLKEYSGTFPELVWGKMICYKLRCLLTLRVSQILSLTRLIPGIKSILCQKDFSLQIAKLVS